jgi:hypothetical protein
MRVSGRSLDLLHRGALSDEQCRRRVPQIVEPELLGQAGPHDRRLEVPPHEVPVPQGRALGRREHQSFRRRERLDVLPQFIGHEVRHRSKVNRRHPVLAEHGAGWMDDGAFSDRARGGEEYLYSVQGARLAPGAKRPGLRAAPPAPSSAGPRLTCSRY